MLAVLTVVAGCGGGNNSTFSPNPDDGAADGATDALEDVEDVVDATSGLDVQGIDIPEPVDLGGNNPPPTDSGPAPVDTGTSSGGVCPAACSVSSDCNPCWASGEAHMSNNYCCVSGLCIFRTGTCDTTTPVDGGTTPGGGDGGAGLDSGPTGTDASAGGDGG